MRPGVRALRPGQHCWDCGWLGLWPRRGYTLLGRDGLFQGQKDLIALPGFELKVSLSRDAPPSCLKGKGNLVEGERRLRARTQSRAASPEPHSETQIHHPYAWPHRDLRACSPNCFSSLPPHFPYKQRPLSPLLSLHLPSCLPACGAGHTLYPQRHRPLLTL